MKGKQRIAEAGRGIAIIRVLEAEPAKRVSGRHGTYLCRVPQAVSCEVYDMVDRRMTMAEIVCPNQERKMYKPLVILCSIGPVQQITTSKSVG